MHHIPEPNPAFDELAVPVVLDFLRSIPTSWARFNMDSLSYIENRAQFLLVAAGLVERRIRMRIRLVNDDRSVDATITVYGEGGLPIAFQSLLAAMWVKWKEPYEEWMGGPTAATLPLHCESIGPDEWRLTDQGILARAEVLRNEIDYTISYVFRLGPLANRHPCRGDGRLVRMDWIPDEAPDTQNPVAVNVKNWDEGARLLAAALEQKSVADRHRGASRDDTNPATSPDAGPIPRPAPDPDSPTEFAPEGSEIPSLFVGVDGPLGPLEGSQVELAWAVDPRPGRRPRERILKHHHGTRVWVQRSRRQTVLVYFLNEKALRAGTRELARIRKKPNVWKDEE